jgi:hypothetical protein
VAPGSIATGPVKAQMAGREEEQTPAAPEPELAISFW